MVVKNKAVFQPEVRIFMAVYPLQAAPLIYRPEIQNEKRETAFSGFPLHFVLETTIDDVFYKPLLR